MDKLRILQSVKRCKMIDNLNTDELRLYLILLANSRGNGDGKILLRGINRIFGEGFSVNRVKTACSKLAEYGLIEVPASSLERIRDYDSKLVYKIFPVNPS
ncbi:MAG: hypothetical protein HY786_00195 [Deltaproteobacteria bacterium]|nr:hypothetical protein [Deltaproteobacteria bacterium]